MEQSLPVYEGPVDHLRYGFKSLESAANAPHPVAQLQRSSGDAEWAAKLDFVRRSYGSHLAMRLATERSMFSRPHRLPGLQSSHVGLDTVTGSDVKIDFVDFLNGTCYFFWFALSFVSLLAQINLITDKFLSFSIFFVPTTSDPNTRPDISKIHLHTVMEVKLGMM